MLKLRKNPSGEGRIYRGTQATPIRATYTTLRELSRLDWFKHSTDRVHSAVSDPQNQVLNEVCSRHHGGERKSSERFRTVKSHIRHSLVELQGRSSRKRQLVRVVVLQWGKSPAQPTHQRRREISVLIPHRDGDLPRVWMVHTVQARRSTLLNLQPKLPRRNPATILTLVPSDLQFDKSCIVSDGAFRNTTTYTVARPEETSTDKMLGWRCFLECEPIIGTPPRRQERADPCGVPMSRQLGPKYRAS